MSRSEIRPWLQRGLRCRDNAEMLEATDRATAAELYAKACVHDDEAACLRSADLEVELSRGSDQHRAQARVLLEMACAREPDRGPLGGHGPWPGDRL